MIFLFQLFTSNEKVTKLAISKIDSLRFGLLHRVLMNSPFQNIILTGYFDSILESHDIIHLLLSDKDILPLLQPFALDLVFFDVINGKSISPSSWTKEESVSFLTILTKFVSHLNETQLERVSKFVSQFSDSNSLQMAIQLLLEKPQISIIQIFCISLENLEFILGRVSFRKKMFKALLPTFLSFDGALNKLSQFFPSFIHSFFKSNTIVQLLINQTDKHADSLCSTDSHFHIFS